MTTAPQPKPIPIPALLVYGKPTSPDIPQASWFPAEDRPTVVAAAQSLKFSVLEIRTEAEKALIVGVHEGVLKGNRPNDRRVRHPGGLQADRRIRGQGVARARRSGGERGGGKGKSVVRTKHEHLAEKGRLRHQPQRPRRRRPTNLTSSRRLGRVARRFARRRETLVQRWRGERLVDCGHHRYRRKRFCHSLARRTDNAAAQDRAKARRHPAPRL